MTGVPSRDPQFEIVANGFKVTLFPAGSRTSAKARSGGVNEGVNEGVKSLLLAIRQKPGGRAPFYAKKLGVPVKSVERWLKRLRDGQCVIYQGAPKTGGYWVKSEA